MYQTFIKILLFVCLWGALDEINILFESIEWVKQIALPDVTGSYPVS